MIKLLCGASSLKCDNYQYKVDKSRKPYCDLCFNLAIENTDHLIMHCPHFEEIRAKMFADISHLEAEYQSKVFNMGENTFHMLLDKIPTRFQPELAYRFLKTDSTNVHKMYSTARRNRMGVG